MEARKYDNYVKRMPISATEYARLTGQSPATISRKRKGTLAVPYFEAALMAGFDEPTNYVKFLENYVA